MAIDVGAGDGGLRELPAVERVELRGLGARRGCEEGVGVVDEFGVGRVVYLSGSDEEEGRGGQER